MVSKNRRLVSGLLSALLVSGSASAGFFRSTMKLAGGVATLAAGASVGYFSYQLFLALGKLSDGSIGFYCCSDGELKDIFDGVEYDCDARGLGDAVSGAICGHLKASALVVGAVVRKLAAKLRQLSGNEVASKDVGGVSLKEVVVDYIRYIKSKSGDVSVTDSKVVKDAVEWKVYNDVCSGKVNGYYGFLSRLFWRIVIDANFSEECWKNLVDSARKDVYPDLTPLGDESNNTPAPAGV